MLPISTTSRVIFQGDSITDGTRDKQHDRNPDSDLIGRSLGCGYAALIGAQLAHDYFFAKAQFMSVIRASAATVLPIYPPAPRSTFGICSRHTSPSSSALMMPGIISAVALGVTHKRHERTYRQLLEDSKDLFPDLELILCQPFTLPCGHVTPEWEADIKVRREIVAQLASDFKVVFVPFQEVFDAACERAEPSYWAGDGVHPTPAGHHLMAQAWLQAVEKALNVILRCS